MKVYLASTDPGELTAAFARGLVDGVWLSPPMLIAASTGRTPDDVLRELVRAARRPVFAPLASVHDEDLLLEGRERARAADGVVVQVPFIDDAFRALHQLPLDGVRVAATLVITPIQALLAARMGASHVVVDVDLLEQYGVAAERTLADIRAVLDRHAQPCDLVALHPRQVPQLVACALAGVDAVVLEPAALQESMAHPLTDRGLDRLLSALSRRPRVIP
jgi:transaldolase